MKHIKVHFLPMMILFSLFLMLGTAQVSAEGPRELDAEWLALNSPQTVTLYKDSETPCYLEVELPADGFYSFISVSDYDTMGYLYQLGNNGLEFVAENDDDATRGERDFCIYKYLNAGTYYLKPSLYSWYGVEQEEASFSILAVDSNYCSNYGHFLYNIAEDYNKETNIITRTVGCRVCDYQETTEESHVHSYDVTSTRIDYENAEVLIDVECDGCGKTFENHALLADYAIPYKVGDSATAQLDGASRVIFRFAVQNGFPAEISISGPGRKHPGMLKELANGSVETFEMYCWEIDEGVIKMYLEPGIYYFALENSDTNQSGQVGFSVREASPCMSGLHNMEFSFAEYDQETFTQYNHMICTYCHYEEVEANEIEHIWGGEERLVFNPNKNSFQTAGFCRECGSLIYKDIVDASSAQHLSLNQRTEIGFPLLPNYALVTFDLDSEKEVAIFTDADMDESFIQLYTMTAYGLQGIKSIGYIYDDNLADNGNSGMKIRLREGTYFVIVNKVSKQNGPFYMGVCDETYCKTGSHYFYTTDKDYSDSDKTLYCTHCCLICGEEYSDETSHEHEPYMFSMSTYDDDYAAYLNLYCPICGESYRSAVIADIMDQAYDLSLNETRAFELDFQTPYGAASAFRVEIPEDQKIYVRINSDIDIDADYNDYLRAVWLENGGTGVMECSGQVNNGWFEEMSAGTYYLLLGSPDTDAQIEICVSTEDSCPEYGHFYDRMTIGHMDNGSMRIFRRCMICGHEEEVVPDDIILEEIGSEDYECSEITAYFTGVINGEPVELMNSYPAYVAKPVAITPGQEWNVQLHGDCNFIVTKLEDYRSGNYRINLNTDDHSGKVRTVIYERIGRQTFERLTDELYGSTYCDLTLNTRRNYYIVTYSTRAYSDITDFSYSYESLDPPFKAEMRNDKKLYVKVNPDLLGGKTITSWGIVLSDGNYPFHNLDTPGRTRITYDDLQNNTFVFAPADLTGTRYCAFIEYNEPDGMPGVWYSAVQYN